MNYTIFYASDGFEFVLYQNLSQEDSLKLLSYRNHVNVRKWMFNSDEITQKNHLKFIDNLKNNDEKVYCIVLRKNKIIGSINYNAIEEGEYMTGFFLNPSLQSSGIGLYFEYIYLKFFFEHLEAKMIKAIVKKDNYAMIKIHELCDFKESSSQSSKYSNYEFTLKEYINIPDNINDFISQLTLKYKIKK